jgi:hypothetical protein
MPKLDILVAFVALLDVKGGNIYSGSLKLLPDGISFIIRSAILIYYKYLVGYIAVTDKIVRTKFARVTGGRCKNAHREDEEVQG